MPCEVSENFIRVRCDDSASLTVLFNKLLEWPYAVRLAFHDPEHIFRDFVISRRLCEVTIERQSDTCFERCEFALSKECKIIIEGYMGIVGGRPASILLATEFWIK
jgi:hypothetical protein